VHLASKHWQRISFFTPSKIPHAWSTLKTNRRKSYSRYFVRSYLKHTHHDFKIRFFLACSVIWEKCLLLFAPYIYRKQLWFSSKSCHYLHLWLRTPTTINRTNDNTIRNVDSAISFFSKGVLLSQYPEWNLKPKLQLGSPYLITTVKTKARSHADRCSALQFKWSVSNHLTIYRSAYRVCLFRTGY
jgi:hypothetical protein